MLSHLVFFFFSTLHLPSFFYISRRTSPKCYRTQTQTRQEVVRMRGRDRRRMRRWWTRVISNQERTALLRTRCTSDPGRATPCAELRETSRTSTCPNGDPLHLTTLTERVNPSQLTAKTLIYHWGLETGWPIVKNMEWLVIVLQLLETEFHNSSLHWLPCPYGVSCRYKRMSSK